MSPIKALSVTPVDPATEGYTRPLLGRADYLDDEETGILEYWRILRRRKGTLILSAFLGIVAAILLGLPQTPSYRAFGTVEIQDVNNDFMHQQQNTPVDTGAADSDIQTQIVVLESETLFNRAAERVNAKYKNVNFPWRRGVSWAIKSKLAQWQNLPQPDPDPLVDIDYLRVKPTGPTHIVEVDYDSPDPQLAADMVNTLTAEYIASNMEERTKMAQRTGQWLSHELDDMRSNMAHSEAALQAYALRSGLLFTSDNDASKTNVANEKLLQVQDELSKAQDERVGIQARYEMAKAAPPDTLADVLNDLSMRNLQDKLTDLRRQQADLVVVYTPDDEKVKRINAQIIPLEAALNKYRQNILDRIHNDYQIAVNREKMLEAEYAKQAVVVGDQTEKSIQYRLLQRDADSNRQLYEAMLQQVQQSNVARAITASNARILDPADLPRLPHSPNYGLYSIIGLLAGVLMGVTFVIVGERSNQTVQQPGEAPFWLNVPELGVIRTVSKGRVPYFRRKALNGQRASESPVLGLGKRSSNGNSRVELVAWHRKPSIASESFRAVLASILFSSQDENRPRVLVLTSAAPGEGKTMVASNLAIALSEIHHKVLLIDADLRKPRLHSLFELSNESGLSTFLREQELTPEVLTLDGLVQPTFIPNLFVLPSGPATPAASSLLHSRHLPELLSTCRSGFDMVIIDTPPVLEMSDARVLGSLADAVILVLRAGQTTRGAAVTVAQRFAEDRTRVLGVVLNAWDPKRSPRGY